MNPYDLIGPLLRLLEPERAHDLALLALRLGLAGGARGGDDPILSTSVLGLDFANPVGLAAGFDKNAQAPEALLRLGFGFVEVGTVTPLAQAGNPRPRLFRLTEDRAVINRMGFNNEGLERVAARLSALSGGSGIVGANIGRNKETADEEADYVTGLEALHGLADYLVVNVSSPNTPGLRGLQTRKRLDGLLRLLLERREALAAGSGATPLLVKIAPDLEVDEREAIAHVALERAIDGLVIGNTTLSRPSTLRSRRRGEAGGLSGAPLFAPSTALLGEMYRLTGGRLPLVGVGGIASAADAYAKIRAGASLVQLYTALVFEGPALVGRIKEGLADLLRRDGFARLADAVGVDASTGS